MKKQSAYLAGPIQGQTNKQAIEWRQEFIRKLTTYDIVGYSPTRGKFFTDSTKVRGQSQELLSDLHTLTTRDRDDVKNCGIMVVNFLGSGGKPSLGSCIEIGWADAWRIPTIVIMNKDNIHYHGMIRDITMVVDSVEKAFELTIQILRANSEV